jgi:hypothetical protein
MKKKKRNGRTGEVAVFGRKYLNNPAMAPRITEKTNNRLRK